MTTRESWFGDAAALGLMATVWLVMCLVASPVGNFPLNDDWVYALAVKSVVESGYYHFPSPSSANVGPQIYWGALFCMPFGFSHTALRMSTLVLGFLGGPLLYGLLRQVGLKAGAAVILGLAMLVNPLYFGLANSFMTDVPFVVVMLASILAFVSAINRDSVALLLVSMALVAAAILIRQVGIVLPIALAAGYLFKRGYSPLRLFVVVLLMACSVGLHIFYQYWLLSTGRTPVLTIHASVQNILQMNIGAWHWRNAVLQMAFYAGFFVLPAVLISAPSGRWLSMTRWRPLLVAALITAFLCASLLRLDVGVPSIPNVLTPTGFGPLTLRDTYVLDRNLPSSPAGFKNFWFIISILSAASLSIFVTILAGSAGKFWKSREALRVSDTDWLQVVIVVGLFAYLATLVFVASRFKLFDRYVLPTLPLLLVGMAALHLRRKAPASAGVTLTVILLSSLAVFSALGTRDYLNWNRARWTLLERLTSTAAITPRQIDGGYEFNGFFLNAPDYKITTSRSWWWVDDDQYMLSSGPLPGYHEIDRAPVGGLLSPTPAFVYVLKRNF